MATFVLIHGAWHGGWCWERVVPALERQGHRVMALDLPGMGADRTAIKTVTLSSWAGFVADEIRKAPEPVVLAGHSRGGLVISQAAELVPDKVAGLVYVAAFLGKDGDSLVSLSGLSDTPRNAEGLVVNADGTLTVTDDTARQIFYHLSPADCADAAIARLRPEPLWVWQEPLRLESETARQIPRAYIEATEDRAIPLASQRLMQTRVHCGSVRSIVGDHSLFYSAPNELTSALAAIAGAMSR
jgi:pimeloyl-ACP methyl ester carboxylesterase